MGNRPGWQRQAVAVVLGTAGHGRPRPSSYRWANRFPICRRSEPRGRQSVAWGPLFWLLGMETRSTSWVTRARRGTSFRGLIRQSHARGHDRSVEPAPATPKRGSEGLEHQATTGRGYQTEVVTDV